MLNDALMVGIVLTLVFGSIIFFLYNRLSMTEKKMGLFEGIITDLKIMMDAAPFASGPPPPGAQWTREFEPTPEYLNAISGPVPLQKEEVEEVSAEEDYQQTLEQALSQHAQVDGGDGQGGSPYRTLQIDETSSQAGSVVIPAINVTKLSPDLDSMTVKELNALAKQRNLSVPAGTRRKDLIDLLKKSQPSGPAQQGLQGTLLAPADLAADLEGPAPPAEGEALESVV
jgi:hypothetical protein